MQYGSCLDSCVSREREDVRLNDWVLLESRKGDMVRVGRVDQMVQVVYAGDARSLVRICLGQTREGHIDVSGRVWASRAEAPKGLLARFERMQCSVLTLVSAGSSNSERDEHI